jgi:hypothetical protein
LAKTGKKRVRSSGRKASPRPKHLIFALNQESVAGIRSLRERFA